MKEPEVAWMLDFLLVNSYQSTMNRENQVLFPIYQNLNGAVLMAILFIREISFQEEP